MEIRSSKFVEPRDKVYLLDEGYAYIPKLRDFTEIPKEEIWGNKKNGGLGGLLKAPTVLQLSNR